MRVFQGSRSTERKADERSAGKKADKQGFRQKKESHDAVKRSQNKALDTTE